jgi:hypothetical protein
MRTRVGVIVLFSCVFSVAAFGQETLLWEYQLKGRVNPAGISMQISLTFETGNAKAVVIYSEPSHRLLGVYVDNTDGEPAEQPWFANLALPTGTSQMHLNLHAGMKGTMTRLPLPEDTDSYLSIRTFVDQFGDVVEDKFRVNMSPGNFHFGLGGTAPEPSARGGFETDAPPVGGHTFVCFVGDGGGCNYAKANCTTSATCCYKTVQGGNCGWCGQINVQCGDGPCNTCPGV